MLLLFTTTNLPEPTKEKMKTLMAVVMQNSLMIQQLQLMVALRQREIEEEENREEGQRQREEEVKVEEEKQRELREEEVRMMRGWTEEESRKHVKRFRGHRRDRRCRRCRWFGHIAHHYRRAEIKAERELRGESYENRWELLRCRVMAIEEERMTVMEVTKVR